MKKLFTSLLAVMMLASMLVLPASADETYTITINGSSTGHTYAAYQIFSGGLSGVILTDIEWGRGIDSAAFLADLKDDATIGSLFTNCTLAKDVAKELADISANSTQADVFAALVGNHLDASSGTFDDSAAPTYKISGLPAGYYLVKDVDPVTGNDAATKYLLKVVSDTEAQPKSAVPKVEKGVGYIKDQTYSDTTDVNIGDNVYYKLTASLPENYHDYKQYKCEFVDTMSAGLTFVEITDVYVLHTSSGSTENITNIHGDCYTVTPGTDGTATTLTITLSNLKTLKNTNNAVINLAISDKIVVKYTAKLDEDAVIGNGSSNGNQNAVKLNFSNNPNQPSNTVETGGTIEIGTTASDTCSVFCYELDIVKVDDTNQDLKLSGAQFVLYRNIDGNITYAKVVNGRIAGWAKYLDADAATAAGGDVNDIASVLTTGTDGTIKFVGLDQGGYFLKELVAPASYNKLSADVLLTITATPNNTDRKIQSLTITSNGTFNGTPDDGIVSLNVLNGKGTTLPETGGIGTTLFYIAGIALMAGAVVVFVAKKRTGNTK